MNAAHFIRLGAILALLGATSFAAPRTSGAYALPAEALDAGGAPALSVAYTNLTGSVGLPIGTQSSGAYNNAGGFVSQASNSSPSLLLTGNNPLTVEAAATYTDPGATASDPEDGALTPTITSNTVVPNVPGIYAVTWSATDSGGLTVSVTRTVTVTPANPSLTVLASKLGAVPGAGVDANIPAGAVWVSFGVPSINDAGTVAFLGTMKVGTASTATIFAGSSAAPGVIVKKGQVAPGLANVVLSTLKDPLLAPDGAVAFVATLANVKGQTGVTTANNQAVYLDADGSGPNAPGLIARKGAEPAGVAGGQWKAFTSVALGERAVAITGTMVTGLLGAPGPGGVTTASDSGLWIYNRTASTMTLALREGGALLGSTVKTIAALVSRTGSPGQGRSVESDGAAGQVVLRVTLADGRQAVGSIDESGAASFPYVKDGSAIAYNATTPPLWSSFGLPTQNIGSALAFLGTVKTATVGPTTANNVALYAEDDMTFEAARLVTKGDMAPGVTSGVFSAFQDPVGAANRSIAFRGTLATNSAAGITTANNMGLWWRDGAGMLNFVARKGAVAAEAAPAGIVPLGVEPLPKWNAFTSLALPEGATGPLFVASLINKTPVPVGSPKLPGPGGVTTATDVGLWAVDSLGAVRLLLREGDTIGASTVKTFTVLTAVAGSPSQRRGFNNNGQVIVRVTDAASAQHLVRIDVP